MNPQMPFPGYDKASMRPGRLTPAAVRSLGIRNKWIVEKRSQGWLISEIAEFFNLSEERVLQILSEKVGR